MYMTYDGDECWARVLSRACFSLDSLAHSHCRFLITLSISFHNLVSLVYFFVLEHMKLETLTGAIHAFNSHHTGGHKKGHELEAQL